MKRFLFFILLCGALCAQTIPPGAGLYSLSSSSGSGSSGTVTSVSFTGGLISVANPTTTPAFTVAGTSGGIPYFSSTSTWASSSLLTASAIVVGGGAGAAPSTPSATATLDASGNISTPGSGTFGAGGSIAGYAAFGQGTATTAPASSAGFMAPTSVTTKYMMTLPAAPATGVMLNTGATDPSTISFIAPGSNGNVLTSNGTTWTSAAAAGGTPGSPATSVQVNVGGVFTGNANFEYVDPLLTLTQAGLAATPASSLTLINTTAATVGTQVQDSPFIYFQGSSWRSNATAASQTMIWRMGNTPNAAPSSPYATLVFDANINGGGFSTQFYCQSVDGSLRVQNAGTFGFGGSRSLITSPADGQIKFTASDTTTFATILGTNTNNNAAAGGIGEYVTGTVATGSSISVTTNTAVNVITAGTSLTAGDWDVWGVVDYTFGATTSVTYLAQGISTTTNTLGAQDTFSADAYAAMVPTAAADPAKTTPVVRLSLAGTTTVYLVTKATFTISTLKAYGSIYARRVR